MINNQWYAVLASDEVDGANCLGKAFCREYPVFQGQLR